MMKESQLQNEISEEFVNMLPEPKERQLFKISAIGFTIVVLAVFATIFWPKYVYSPHDSATFVATTAKQVIHITTSEQGFIPATVQISTGTTVVWNNAGVLSHEIAANPFPSKSSLPSLDSGHLSSGQSYQYRFDKPGTYSYHDQLNPLLSGTIVVK